MRGKILGLLAATALAMPMAAHAATKVASGGAGGLSWTAQSTIVGVGSTGTLPAGGGSPAYLANTPAYSGTVALIMNYGAAGSFICSGTLASDRRSIITAAHCVSDGTPSGLPLSTTAYFGGGTSPADFFNGPGTTAIGVSDIYVNPEYTGEVIDQNDIAVLRLSTWAPESARSHEILTAGDLTGLDFNVAGYGGRSTIGGNAGVNAGTGRLRQGDNRYDFALGDADFGGFFTARDGAGEGFFGFADYELSFLSDFDNGLAANDTSCITAVGGLGVAPSSKFCDLGRGFLEVGVAGGDSGGPQFIGGKLASVTSYGLTFGCTFGDIDFIDRPAPSPSTEGPNGRCDGFDGGRLNSSFGEFSGYVPTYIHEKFISERLYVPEPATWLQMIFGFGLIGSILRRRQAAKAAVA